jgi:hypothetical protein
MHGSKREDFERDHEDRLAAIEDPFADAAPPPAISNGFFSWFSPVLHVHEQAMLEQIGEPCLQHHAINQRARGGWAS